jgi:hypothetical protein
MSQDIVALVTRLLGVLATPPSPCYCRGEILELKAEIAELRNRLAVVEHARVISASTLRAPSAQCPTYSAPAAPKKAKTVTVNLQTPTPTAPVIPPSSVAIQAPAKPPASWTEVVRRGRGRDRLNQQVRDRTTSTAPAPARPVNKRTSPAISTVSTVPSVTPNDGPRRRSRPRTSRNIRNTAIIGTGPTHFVSTCKARVAITISRLSPQTSADDIKEHLKNTQVTKPFLPEIDINNYQCGPYFSSFKVTFPKDLLPILGEPHCWPTGSIIRRYYTRKPKDNNINTLERANATDMSNVSGVTTRNNSATSLGINSSKTNSFDIHGNTVVTPVNLTVTDISNTNTNSNASTERTNTLHPFREAAGSTGDAASTDIVSSPLCEQRQIDCVSKNTRAKSAKPDLEL